MKRKPDIRGVEDPATVEAMNSVPRERFVSEGFSKAAYHDGPLPIGFGQTISQPYIVALMTEQARLSPDSRVLEIGTGCGYQTAVLSEIVEEVCTVEVIEELSLHAQKVLKELKYANIKFKIGDGNSGWQEHAPYDAIIATAAPEEIPKALIEQLAVSGTLIIPVGKEHGVQKLLQVSKLEDESLETRTICQVRFVPFV